MVQSLMKLPEFPPRVIWWGEECKYKFNDSTKEAASKIINPKDLAGSHKVGVHVVPPNVITAMALALQEGALKYGESNWREHSIHYSAYYDAVMRHMFQWFNGEDTDVDSGLPHVVKAMATLAVLVDAMHNNKVIDDRPIGINDPDWMNKMNIAHNELVERVNAKMKASP